MNESHQIQKTIEFTARASYGKLLAYLSSRSGDIQACEDALAEAFAKALQTWPRDGIPTSPEAWILQVAKNQMLDSFKKEATRTKNNSTVLLLNLEIEETTSSPSLFKDETLKLLFVCAHPSIDESVRTPLMLQTVLGMKSEDIAPSFLSSPQAMQKKLVRAKEKIKKAGIAFEIPDEHQLSERLNFVCDAIYAAYGKSWDDLGVEESEYRELDEEAIFLAQVLEAMMPFEPEPKGLLALMIFCQSRKESRRGKYGEYVPLDQQDTQKWDLKAIDQAENLLRKAFSLNKMGRFQIEACLQSAHAARIFHGINNWQQIADLYDGLISIHPTLGAHTGRIHALMKTSGASVALNQLNELPIATVQSYQPYWVIKAELLKTTGQNQEAIKAFSTAIGLTSNPVVRDFLQKQKDRIKQT